MGSADRCADLLVQDLSRVFWLWGFDLIFFWFGLKGYASKPKSVFESEIVLSMINCTTPNLNSGRGVQASESIKVHVRNYNLLPDPLARGCIEQRYMRQGTVFLPIWLFHAVVARGRFSLPAPSVPHDRHWAPCHAVVAAPLIIAFELLLCVYLESLSVNGAAAVSLKIVFFPLLAFETIILIDNFSIAECFAFLVCTKWSNPMIHTNSCPMENTASVCPDQDQNQESLCGLPDIGGHFMKIPIIAFQVLLCMRLEGTPSGAKNIPFPVLFSPLFLLQGVGVLFAMSRLVEKIYLLLRSDAGQGPYLNLSAKLGDCLAFMHHGSRLIGWWSIDEGSHEERAKLLLEGASRYNTFCQFPPEIVKKMPKKDLAEEVWKLQAALVQQTEITKNSQQETKFSAEYALREILVLFCSPVGIGSSAVSAATSAKDVQFAESLLMTD
uniref:Uncharacterized protein n=1 Tax=Chenopodium quinoa TaxID=63459 RepID=A0A803NC63_CHEQI